MSILFSGNEIVDIAVRIEENGREFYLAATERAEDENLKVALNKLADDETQHKETFQNLYKAEEPYTLSPEYGEEVDAYIKAMASAQVFAPGKSVSELARSARDIFEVLILAMGAEKDSILYYSEMREWVQPGDKDTITRIIAEEKTHLQDLTQLYGKIKGA